METKTINVLTERLLEAEVALDKLARKARRYGNPDISWSRGEAFKKKVEIREWDGGSSEMLMDYTPLVVTGQAPTVGRYRFLARVEFLDGAPLLTTAPDAEGRLHHRFRATDRRCEHCRHDRQRNDVYVVENLETGEQMQVGRTCLRDFLGTDTPAGVAQRFEFWNLVSDRQREEGGYASASISVHSAVRLGLATIRVFGWMSKSAAREDERPTASYVALVLNPYGRTLDPDELEIVAKIKAAARPDDAEEAQRIMDWVRDEMRGDSEYNYNLRTLFAAGSVPSERVGFVVSAVAAFNKAMDIQMRRTREAASNAASQHVGSVGARLRDLDCVLTGSINLGDGQFGPRLLHKFRDAAGNVLIWFTGNGTGLNVGERCLLDASVKEHSERDGVKQTIVSRVKVKGWSA